jgi:dTMP kinase
MISGRTRMSQTGFFISFEGSEGCGKSTQIRLLAEALSTAGITPVLVREPGSTPIGERIRHLLQHSVEGRAMEPETELLLFAASRAQIVISDRFLDSTTVYQGIARSISPEMVEKINRFAAGPRLPDITFLLDMDSAEAHRRLTRRPAGTHDRMEEQPTAFFEAVRRGYLELAAAQPNRFRLLDAAKPEQEIAREIRVALRSHALFKGIRV